MQSSNLKILKSASFSAIIMVSMWFFLVLWVLVVKPDIIAPETINSILMFSIMLALVSLGQSIILISGGAGIDLSVGGIISLVAVTAAGLANDQFVNFSLPVICIIFGFFLGIINGFLVYWLQVFPLIITLGTFYVYSGVALAVTSGSAISGIPDWATAFCRSEILAIPVPFILLVIPIFCLTYFVYSKSPWGRWYYAMGEDENAAVLAGVPVRFMRCLNYGICGGLCGLAAFFSLGWLATGRPNIGLNFELESLAASLLGGVAIFGGRGNVVSVLIAVLLIVSFKTVLLQYGINTVWQTGLVGLLLILIVALDFFKGTMQQ